MLVEAPLGPPASAARGTEAPAAYLTQVLGDHFTLLHFAADGVLPADLAGLEAGMRACGIRWRTVVLGAGTDEAAAALRALYGATRGASYLVRPDGHVLARWRRCTARQVRDAVVRVLDRVEQEGSVNERR